VIEIKAPNRVQGHYNAWMKIFLAGSIEMGAAEDWQSKVVKDMANYEVVLLNPRRDNWDPSWVQSIDNPKFTEQVTWELDEMTNADIVIFYFDETTKSPITLLELGLACGQANQQIIVCCPDKFWRKGNVDIVCSRFGEMVSLVDTYEDLIKSIYKLLKYADVSLG